MMTSVERKLSFQSFLIKSPLNPYCSEKSLCQRQRENHKSFQIL
jgi:hypothetical protein